MGLSLCISTVQTYDRKVIPLKLSPIIDMVLKEDEEAEKWLTGDWTAGTTAAAPTPTAWTWAPANSSWWGDYVCKCEQGHMLQGSYSRMRRSPDVQKRTDEGAIALNCNHLLFVNFRCSERAKIRWGSSEPRSRAGVWGVTDTLPKGHSGDMSHQVKGQGRNSLTGPGSFKWRNMLPF